MEKQASGHVNVSKLGLRVEDSTRAQEAKTRHIGVCATRAVVVGT